MPSAVRQKLPLDFCHQGHRKHFNGSSLGSIYHVHEVQASPGLYDVSEEEKQQQKHHGSKRHVNKSPRKQAIFTSHGSPKFIPRRSSSDLSLGLSDSDKNKDDEEKMVQLSSSSPKYHNCPKLSPVVSDAYAMDSSVAPHPSEVPLPPLEWLQSTKQTVPAVISGMTLRTILSCHVAA